MDLYNWAYKLFRELHMEHTAALYANLGVNLLCIGITSLLLYYIARRALKTVAIVIARRSKSTFDDFLVLNGVPKHIAWLVPLLLVYNTVPIALEKFLNWEYIFSKGFTIVALLLTLRIIGSIMRSIRDYLKQQPGFNDKPIDSYIQVVMILLWLFAAIAMVLILFNVKLLGLLGAFGTVSAVIILIFKDTLLGFVASIQISVNDIVRIGDWITFEKFGADGYVTEINLATVRVQNFDNTFTTVPTYSLISDSFKNWRGMLNSGGRRIKRHILIKANSVKFIGDSEIENLKKIQLVTDYLTQRKADIDKYNAEHNIDKSLAINGRNLTNLGVFRKYINRYIETHPGVNSDLTIMCRHLQPTDKGTPLEIYMFTKDKRWINHEYIMADIFDHIIASVEYFGLEIFELPSQGQDVFEG
ncbi:mechanosensitive ion channel family protein [Flavobacterium sp. RHBU_3]|uniref:mechanosensitive ion channel family protein n=1 Tax=Flavobacterium sp. RHBU_3 TaxID=3391184 RepID=UPI003985622D